MMSAQSFVSAAVLPPAVASALGGLPGERVRLAIAPGDVHEVRKESHAREPSTSLPQGPCSQG